MKKILLLLLVMISVSELQAKVLTVSNRAGASAQYQTVPAAIAAAAAGDTIYIHGSETNYGAITLDKKLTIIGTGHKPKKELALISELTSVTIGVQNAAASGSALIGLKLSSVSTSNYGQKDIVIRRCYISNIVANGTTGGICTNWIIENNIFSSLQTSSNRTNVYNFLIRNNIITSYLYYTNACVINNNIFLGSQSPSFSDVHYAIIQNNVFYGRSPQGANNSTLNNNISFNSTETAMPYGTNSGSNNKVNVDPKFITYSGGTFNYEHNYNLQASSPGKAAGTDGTDIGIYGGMGFSETGEPPIPMVRAFSIQNGVVAPNGKLNVIIKAEAKN
ncbi:hypothetical protein ACMA1I_00595 [Pontibacter sp. 13R65]|uniref:hypothetical protein n=1 Tax=Pontibacter sp. 13R65 TaxID=3127458 RepID=UPI00301C0F3F